MVKTNNQEVKVWIRILTFLIGTISLLTFVWNGYHGGPRENGIILLALSAVFWSTLTSLNSWGRGEFR